MTSCGVPLGMRKNLEGMKFGRWSVGPLSHIKNRASYWHCACECGNSRVVLGATLINGTSQSCGCLTVETTKRRLTKHGLADTKPHMVWCSMRQRCKNPSTKGYRNYGARGIRVCDRWAQSFEAFWTDMGPTYRAGLTLERVNNNGNYEPGNCVWIEKNQQSKNRRPSSEWRFKKNETSTSGRGVSG